MSEGAMAVVKPGMKSYVWLQTADGSIQQVEEEVAMCCPMICGKIIQTDMGSSKNYAILLPQRVNPAALGLILDYCRFHHLPGRSNKERKSYDERLIRMDTKRLCELASAAHSLQLRPLIDLTCRALARIIEGKTIEEIREIFHLPDDLTEEEKLEPVRNFPDDPRIRLLNRLYARKRKELKEREKLKNIEVEEEIVDERSVDDLLSFINGGGEDSKAVEACKSKKKHRRRKDQQNYFSLITEKGNHKKDLDGVNSSCPNGANNDKVLRSPGKSFQVQDYVIVTCSTKPDFHGRLNPALKDDDELDFEIEDDDDIDDDLDPAMKEELDREVEEFARRLNSVWAERMQEVIAPIQESRILSLSPHRYTSLDAGRCQ